MGQKFKGGKMLKCKYKGKLGIHPVYQGKKGTFAIAQYSNVMEIIPVKPETRVKIKGIDWWVDSNRKIRQIKRTGTFKSELKYAKGLIGCSK